MTTHADNGHDPPDDDAVSVRPGSNHDLGAAPTHADPDDPKTAAGYLHHILRKVGLLETEADSAREYRREHARAIEANQRANRAMQTALEAQGRTIEQFQTEVRGSFAGLARTNTSIANALDPFIASRTQWGMAKAMAKRVGVVIGAVAGFAALALKVFEAWKGH